MRLWGAEERRAREVAPRSGVGEDCLSTEGRRPQGEFRSRLTRPSTTGKSPQATAPPKLPSASLRSWASRRAVESQRLAKLSLWPAPSYQSLASGNTTPAKTAVVAGVGYGERDTPMSNVSSLVGL